MLSTADTIIGMLDAFLVAPAAIIVLASGSIASRVQMAGGDQLIIGFLPMLDGAWDGDRSADTWRWLAICLSVDLLLGAGAVALAASPITALEVLALTLDLAKLIRKTVDVYRRRAQDRRTSPRVRSRRVLEARARSYTCFGLGIRPTGDVPEPAHCHRVNHRA